MTPLMVNILLGSIFISIIIFGCYLTTKKVVKQKTKDSVLGIGVGGLISVGAFGFGVYGVNGLQYEDKTYPEHVEILKSTTTVYLEVDGEKYNTTDYYSINNISDSTEFYYINGYNMYNHKYWEDLYYVDKLGKEQIFETKKEN